MNHIVPTAAPMDGKASGGTAFDAELRTALTKIARVPQLLVACDYDGTLAPIVTDPSTATPRVESVTALRALANLSQTKVAVISGRALRDLAALSRLPSEVHLVGSHGSEFDIGFTRALSAEQLSLRNKIIEALNSIADIHEGVRIELKPAGAALHTRELDRATAAKVITEVKSGPANWDGVQVTEGKEVVDLSVVTRHKGNALDDLRQQLGASAVLFIGDDITDENAFASLHGPDIGVRVGPGQSRAAYRVNGTLEVAQLLATLVEIRSSWLHGEDAQLIERHSMLADGANCALVTPDARITWMCHPRPDSGAVFADLLGGTPAGHFSVSPVDAGMTLSQRYIPGTMTVETKWAGLTVTDWLDATPLQGGDAHSTVLVRTLAGRVPTRIEFAPRPEFGQTQVRLQPLGDGVLVLGGNEPIALRSPGVEWKIVSDGEHDTAKATVDLSEYDEPLVLELRCGSDSVAAHDDQATARWEATEAPRRDWVKHLTLPGRDPDMVARSALTLKGLCHEPTGGIMAAATTSLPEHLGGVRNWDYRFCWLRDGSMTARALVDLGSLDEATGFFEWVAGVVERTGGHPEWLAPLYTIDGMPLGPEAVIDSLPGYAGSRPVRVSNAANRQVQLDVFGPVADLVAAVAERRGSVTEFEGKVITSMVDAVERRWHEPDHGVWEERQAPRHHVYSKVMCWMTVDRALKLCENYGLKAKPSWEPLRQTIADNVIELGWHEDVGAYTAAYGDTDLDAASLWIGMSGLLPADDPRFTKTINAIEASLRSGPTVYRYRKDDGLPGTEGGFILCASWLAEAYLLIGRITDAEELYQQILKCAGPTGLLAEEWDPIAERGLGNHPQAYSHLGFIRLALLLDQLDRN
ncbi:trehalose-phosphatase [Stackebrandtia nassauensis]|uniref:Trehalose-phosphatase n=1 Tax=Stackebrandtia nassauensis (strain DSM 44728 / CIP 108903 / NRRL B-16338 / NBRC 102104 / LLR-40K-21) TaxID=446470 RepID=D3Q6P3_STANL|nr:trehalose-phosphatase [Stackebrandtia nassauensis]ADD44286.1 trehalose-phosphatase [Stackebrandtia nassauensis DSM 44728]